MLEKMTGSKKNDAVSNAIKRGAAMLDVIVLAASLIFILAACAAAG